MSFRRTAAIATAMVLGVCALLAAACGERTREPLSNQESRLVWEYKFQKWDNPKVDAEKVFNDLGREGWEFVTVFNHGEVNQFGAQPEFVVFKRLKK